MSWQSNAEYWKQLPRRSTVRFLCAVFSLFTSFAFIAGDHDHPLSNLLSGLLNGLFAAVWAFAGTRRLFKLMIALLGVQIAANVSLSFAFDKLPFLSRLNAPAVKAVPGLNAAIAITLIMIGYLLFLSFFSGEGARYFSTLTEMRLAGEIHRNLVPELRLRDHAFEFYGRSWPSGEVGGDLVDVIRSGWGWLAYVADVSGHGVPAGVLMTMMKSAARTRLAAAGPEGFLPAINEVLLPLSEPNMYVTLALLSYSADRLHFATAGHPPILQYRHATGQVEERANENFPVALIGNAAFEISQTGVAPGDVLVILTDGLTEVADSADCELTLEPLKAVLLAHAGRPLPEVAEHLRACALAHGKQTDDQTLLLVRLN